MAETKAVIWDMDGVIADTAPYHFSAWQETFRRRGVKFTKEDFRHSFGLRNENIISNILGETPQGEIEAIARGKEVTFRSLIGQEVRPLPGVIALIRSLRENGFKMAIASSTPIENIRLITGGLGIENCFQAIVSSQDVTEGKPSPQAFLLAAQRLGVEPRNCLVIEDAVAGITAAKKASMSCLAVTNTHPSQSLAEADLIVDSLEKVTINDIEGLINPP